MKVKTLFGTLLVILVLFFSLGVSYAQAGEPPGDVETVMAQDYDQSTVIIDNFTVQEQMTHIYEGVIIMSPICDLMYSDNEKQFQEYSLTSLWANMEDTMINHLFGFTTITDRGLIVTYEYSYVESINTSEVLGTGYSY